MILSSPGIAARQKYLRNKQKRQATEGSSFVGEMEQ
ncbi:hypothetical protein ES703_19632 [subsurface metagenome]